MATPNTDTVILSLISHSILEDGVTSVSRIGAVLKKAARWIVQVNGNFRKSAPIYQCFYDFGTSSYGGGREWHSPAVAGLSAIPIRDSKDPDGSVLIFTAGKWEAFIAGG
jgi:uncharacterized protein DUF397